LGKIKIFELAKELDVNNKDLVAVAKDLGLDVKSHLSSIDEEDAKKIKASMKKSGKKEASKSESSKSKEENSEKATKKTTGNVIIRREVIVEEEQKPVKKAATVNRNDIGFTKQRTNQNYNIVYREKQQKPMSVAELFGLKDPKKEAEEKAKKEAAEKAKKEAEAKAAEEAKKAQAAKAAEAAKVEKPVVRTEMPAKESAPRPAEKRSSKLSGRTERADRALNSNANFNRPNAGNNDFKNRGEGFRQDRNNNFRPGFNRNQGEGNFRNNRQQGEFKPRNTNQGSDNFRKPMVRKDEVSAPETFEDQAGSRNYSNRMIDKQKANRVFEEKKKNVRKSRRMEGGDEFDEYKLRDLKSTDKLSNMYESEDGGMLDYYDLSSRHGKRRKAKKEETVSKQKIFELKEIDIGEIISVKNLATELKKTSAEVVKKLFDLGIMATINQELDFDTAYLVADSFGIKANKKVEVKDEDILFDDSEDKEEDLVARPPVVVVMGHVDHGKTSLLDAIRKTNVIEGEAGGITQHIGAYKVKINDREITFLDTPGHEAFTSMRARGAQITDVAILVVAADDGVMPQTVEAINHAKAANIPIIVAVNKIDLPGANVDKVKQELMKYELVPEEWGGSTIYVPISAKKNINIDNLLEMVLLVSDMANLRANPNRQAKGVVIEARLDKAQGPIASVLVQRGTLSAGDTVIVGEAIGKIRIMKNDKGKNIREAGPSTPVEITGLKDVPAAGDILYEVKNEKVAKHLIEQRKIENREKKISNDNMVTIDNLFDKMKNDDLKQFNIIVKTDVQGTAEAFKSSLEKLSNEEVLVKVLHSSAGAVTESDVELAKAANAIIIAFNVRPVGATKQLAEKEGVEIKQYSIIYQALEDVQNAMKGMLAPVYQEITIGNAEVRQVFKVSNVGTIAGCYVTDGKVARNAGVRVIREGVVIHEGKLVSLKRFKDDAKEVSAGFECGVQIENFNDIILGDTIEAYIKQEVQR
jgi:translation initiation factor IF-2